MSAHPFQSIEQYHQALRLGDTTVSDTVDAYLQRIDASSSLNAFVEVYAREARQQATELDARRSAGAPMKRLHGVIVAIKDVISYRDHLLTAGSKMLSGFRPLFQATAVQALLEEEAIIVGNCNCDEFAMGSSNENSVYGPVHNALDPSRVPGGSSGGSAVAVQADLCMLSLGSDTGGSVRQPADFCGIIGFKPGYGRISRHGLIAYASSFDQIGIFGKTVSDIALCLDVISCTDDFDSTLDPIRTTQPYHSFNQLAQKPVRIAYFRQCLEHPSLDPEIAAAIQQTIESLRAAGHAVEAVEFDLLDYIVPTYYVLTTAEASSNLSRYDGIRFGHQTKNNTADLAEFYSRNRSEGFGKEVQRRILLGSFVLSAGYYDAYFNKAQQVRRLLFDQLQALFNQYDFLISPTSPTTAFKIGEKNDDPLSMYLADIFTVLANLTGIPGISVPLYQHSNSLPFGLQIMSNQQKEINLFQISDWLLRSKN
jgi:aspartyl-tRNA(Asn)/glutamyl-tRNA(Gln) amidotransferase subunit A